MSDWQPIETAPAGAIVLGYSISGNFRVGVPFDPGRPGDYTALIHQPSGHWWPCTHWMPLPPPPTQTPP